MRYQIYQNDQMVNTIVADRAFVTRYCEKYGYTWQAAPLPPPEPGPEQDIWAEMAEAIAEGVNEV